MLEQIENLLASKKVSSSYFLLSSNENQSSLGINSVLIKSIENKSFLKIVFEEDTYKIWEVLSHNGEVEGYLPIGSYKTLEDAADSLVSLSEPLFQVDTEVANLPF